MPGGAVKHVPTAVWAPPGFWLPLSFVLQWHEA
jgi:hypothetical protein